MSKLSAYTYYQNTPSPTVPTSPADSLKPAVASGSAPAATVQISEAARQAAEKSPIDTNTIWGSSPRQ
jgi:hypothetical protein